MGQIEIFRKHFKEVNDLSSVLSSYANTYRLLVGAAGELNTIAKVRKRDLDDALDRVDEMGKIIDSILEVIKENEETYIKYIKLKSKFIMEKASKDVILTEVEQDLLFENSNREEKE
ncbi:oligoendopeptidase F family protein [Clostridium perfringens]|uniref:oligoendopeptidase F family protein n=1 Tax=Clostridium perfringens TaxID=1502 RepID=UPI00111EA5BC|nr:oligoendopeptidase F family protein [Clostridium perfringens]TPE21274.1 oligoendopeptidase F family protein [Clostridium perfringens]